MGFAQDVDMKGLDKGLDIQDIAARWRKRVVKIDILNGRCVCVCVCVCVFVCIVCVCACLCACECVCVLFLFKLIATT